VIDCKCQAARCAVERAINNLIIIIIIIIIIILVVVKTVQFKWYLFYISYAISMLLPSHPCSSLYPLYLHTAKTIDTSIVHYCNSMYYGLPKYQINRLQHIQNSLPRTVVQAPKFQHITPILKSFHWLKVSERIEYKIISLTKLSIPLSHHISMTL